MAQYTPAADLLRPYMRMSSVKYDVSLANKVSFAASTGSSQLTPVGRGTRVKDDPMSVNKIQIGQLWKKDGTGDTYLVTRVYSEALTTMIVLRKSGSEDEALTRVRAERTPKGQNIPGFTPAMEDEHRS